MAAGPRVVGGGGEKRTLRFVARYADACNLVALDARNLDALRRKLDVLDGHCDDAGRDPKDITRTVCLFQPPESGDELATTVGSLLGVGFEGVVLFALNRDPDTVHGWGETLVGAHG